MTVDRNPYAAPTAPAEDEPGAAALVTPALGPKGIGGWLILPLLGLCSNVIQMSRELWQAYEGVLSAEVWPQLTTPGQPDYHRLWAPAIVFEVGSTALLLAFTVALLVLFVKQSRYTPKLMVFWLLVRPAVALVVAALVSRIQGSLAQAAGSVVFQAVIALLWVVYFLSSRRVKNTFVR